MLGWIVAVFSFSIGRAQTYDINKKYPVGQLREDFGLLRSALERSHPSTYWYTPKDSMTRFFDETYTRIDHQMTEREFYHFLAPVLARVHCGHTYPEMSEAYYEHDTVTRHYLPFELFLDEDRLFIVKNGSTDSSLAEGDEILKLDGVPVKEMADLARTLISADGDNASWKNAFMQMYYVEEVYLEYYHGKPPFKLTIRSTDGSIRETVVRARPRMTRPVKQQPELSRKQQMRQEKLAEEAERAAMCRLRFTKGDSNAAILSVRGFSYESVYGVSFYKKHRSVFKAIAERNVANLVIDLRGNSGGNLAIAEDLMAYLMDKPFRVVEKNELYTENVEYLDLLQSHFEKQPKSHGFQANRLRKTGENTYTFKFGGRELLKPAGKYRFSGNVYVITDGWVFSAGSLFVSSLRSQRKITVVGEETGGGAVGCSGGRISRLVLPNTGLRVFFPHFRIYAVTQTGPDGHGVLPDYPVKPTLKDFAQKRDPQLAKTFDLIFSTK